MRHRTQSRPERARRTARAVFLWTILGGVLGTMGSARVSSAQDYQSYADSTRVKLDYTRYKTVFQCLGATNRAKERSAPPPISNDTIIAGPNMWLTELPPLAIETAKQCSAKFRVDEVPLSEYTFWHELFLRANRDADAMALTERLLAASNASGEQLSPDERAEKLWELIMIQENAKPLRVGLMYSLVQKILALETTPWFPRFRAAWSMHQTSRMTGDTAIARVTAQAVVDIGEKLTLQQKNDIYYRVWTWSFVDALRYLNDDAGLDSLRKSTAAYVALQQSFASRMSAEDQMLGTKAQPVVGDFWFPAKPAETVPVPGRVTLVLYPDAMEDVQVGLRSMIARLKARFPTMDVVIFSFTSGTVATPVPPAEEAEYLKKRWLEFFQFPATLAIETTEFWRLPDPDRRRVGEMNENVKNYGMGTIWLIDQTGTIVHYSNKAKDQEVRFQSLIQVLFDRAK